MLNFLDRETVAGHRLVAAFVIATEGSTYRKPGALMLLSSSGARCSLLSGGCLEGEGGSSCFKKERDLAGR